MGKKTSIAWCKSTFNPWWLCTEVSPGCDNCYARFLAKRFGYGWGAGVPRRYFGDKHWAEPLHWNREAAKTGEFWPVFCASMADVFDNEVEDKHRHRLWKLIYETPYLTWLIVTKRIGNAKHMLSGYWSGVANNTWLISTVINQEEADRDIPKLLEIPAVIHGLSVEPMLGPVDLSKFSGLDWAIYGGESKQGAPARPCQMQWIMDGVRQCREHGVTPFVKQLGSLCIDPNDCVYETKDKAGADPEEWPADLRVQEWPNVSTMGR